MCGFPASSRQICPPEIEMARLLQHIHLHVRVKVFFYVQKTKIHNSAPPRDGRKEYLCHFYGRESLP